MRQSGQLAYPLPISGTLVGSGSMSDDNYIGLGAFLFFTLMLIAWLVCAAVAGIIATARERSFWGFAAVTFFFLGPLGPGFALIATHGAVENERFLQAARAADSQPDRRKIAEGRQRFICPRCGAENDIPNADTSYACWRCSEHRKVTPKVAKSGESNAVKSS
jgi:hypothetical protein